MSTTYDLDHGFVFVTAIMTSEGQKIGLPPRLNSREGPHHFPLQAALDECIEDLWLIEVISLCLLLGHDLKQKFQKLSKRHNCQQERGHGKEARHDEMKQIERVDRNWLHLFNNAEAIFEICK
jgi:hypothetical protein